MQPILDTIRRWALAFPLTQKREGLHHRSDLHLARKFFHMSGGLLYLSLYVFLGLSRETMAAILGIVLAATMSVEYSRARWEWVNAIAVRAMGPVMRDTEVSGLTGIPFYMASCLFAFLIFPRHIAVLAILYLALGDPSSSFFGVLYGRAKIFPNKSLQGTLGGFLVCAVATGAYLLFIQFPSEKLLIMTLLGGFAGCTAELLPLNVDDNLAIPVVSGVLMILAFWAAGVSMG